MFESASSLTPDEKGRGAMTPLINPGLLIDCKPSPPECKRRKRREDWRIRTCRAGGSDYPSIALSAGSDRKSDRGSKGNDEQRTGNRE
jgi:hypothetical protein